MTRKLKKKPQLIHLGSPLKGKEIQELLGHVTSNPYSPTDHIISDAGHPFLRHVQNEIEGDLQSSIEIRCTKCNASANINDKHTLGIQEALVRGLSGPDANVTNMPKILNLDNLMHLRLHMYEKEIVRLLQNQIANAQKDIRKCGFRHDLLKGIQPPCDQHLFLNKLQDVVIGVQNTILRLDCAFNQNFLQCNTPAVKQTVSNHADIDEEFEMFRHETKAMLQRIKTLSTSAPKKFNEITQDNSQYIAQHLQGVFRRRIHSAIVTAAKVHETESMATAILNLHTYLEELLDKDFKREDLHCNNFAKAMVRNVEEISKSANLLSEINDLPDIIAKNLKRTIQGNCDGQNEHNLEMKSFQAKLEQKKQNLIDEYQRTVAVEVVNGDEHYLTTSHRDHLERHKKEVMVIVRKVRRHAKIFECLTGKAGSYQAKLHRLLKDQGRAYLVTSTYSYLEIGQETQPFQSSGGLNICGKPDSNTSLYVNTEHPTGSVQFDFERFVVLDEKLFALEILRINPSLVRQVCNWLTRTGERAFKYRVVTPS